MRVPRTREAPGERRQIQAQDRCHGSEGDPLTNAIGGRVKVESDPVFSSGYCHGSEHVIGTKERCPLVIHRTRPSRIPGVREDQIAGCGKLGLDSHMIRLIRGDGCGMELAHRTRGAGMRPEILQENNLSEVCLLQSLEDMGPLR